jgi:integrase
MSSVLRSAVEYELIAANPMEKVKLAPERRGKKRNKPYLTPAQFVLLLALIPEPYATMIFVAIYAGLRVSELIGLRWEDIGSNTITVDERCSRGDWGQPKSESSNATIAVPECVIERVHALKGKTVTVKAGRAKRTYQLVKSHQPQDLVFQSVKDGRPMLDNNILTRFIKPAARELGLDFVNWRCLRTSHATWLKMAGADVKDAQAQLRHSRASTTLDIYQQFVPESQHRVVDRLASLSKMVN